MKRGMNIQLLVLKTIMHTFEYILIMSEVSKTFIRIVWNQKYLSRWKKVKKFEMYFLQICEFEKI